MKTQPQQESFPPGAELQRVLTELDAAKQELAAVKEQLQARTPRGADADPNPKGWRRTASQMEDDTSRSHQMETAGRLADGIAHDFSNLFTAIIGYSTLLYERLAGDESAIAKVLEIKAAGEKAASLAQQLPAFGPRKNLQPTLLNLNDIVRDLERTLRRMTGERITIALNCEPDLWVVKSDPGEIGHAIMNLALNSRDAMPEGGALTIETANITLPGNDGAYENLAPGRYAMLAVHDTGLGIDAAVREHIFERSFTTKKIRKITGGLSTVLEIVELSGGTIHCQSENGEGTSFRMLFPATAEALEKDAPSGHELTNAGAGSEVVLLVEDEEAVRKLTRLTLEARGYRVLDAANGREGLALCANHQGPIDLVVTDLMMAEIDGREFAARALRLRPHLEVMFMSGYRENLTLTEDSKKAPVFLPKPFTPVRLAQKVRETLDSRIPVTSAQGNS